MGRIVVGMGIGMASMCIPVYMAETSPVELRGFLGASFQVSLPPCLQNLTFSGDDLLWPNHFCNSWWGLWRGDWQQKTKFSKPVWGRSTMGGSMILASLAFLRWFSSLASSSALSHPGGFIVPQKIDLVVSVIIYLSLKLVSILTVQIYDQKIEQ